MCKLLVLSKNFYFWNKPLHVSGSSSVHHQEFFTVHTAMVYVICHTGFLTACEQDQEGCHTGLLTACEQGQDGTSSVLILLAGCQHTCITDTIAVCTVKNS